jgi:hypothetical protein
MPPERLHLMLFALGCYQHDIPDRVLQIAFRAASMLEVSPFAVSLDRLQSLGDPQCERRTVELAGHGCGVKALHSFRRGPVESLQ